MTMFDFMQNAFFLLCGIICVAAAVLVVYCVIVAIFRTCGRRGAKKNTGYSHNADMQRRNGNERN